MSAENTTETEERPEPPPISPRVRQQLQRSYVKGTQLMAQAKYDFDYAHISLAECVSTDPGNLVYAETFLENLRRKYDDNKRGARVQLFMNRAPFKKALQKRDWVQTLKLGPELLKTNPWDVETLRGMAEACERLSLPEVELLYLKMALDGSPRDIEVNRHCARSLARVGHFDEAIERWTRVLELNRKDEEAQGMIADLQLERARWKGGFVSPEDRAKMLERTGGPPRVAKPDDPDAPIAKKKEKEEEDPTAMLLRRPRAENNGPAETEAPKPRVVPLTRRQQLERAVVDDPTFVDNYLELANIYVEEGRVAEADRALQKAQSASGNDLRVREQLEDVQILRQKQQLTIAEKRFQVEKTATARDLVKQIKENINRAELEMFGRRAERYPERIDLKYELGVRLKRAGNYREAMQQFLDVRDHAELEVPALIELGECLQHLKLFPKAKHAYQKAIAKTDDARESEHRKLALYRAGVLAAAMQDKAAAAYLKELVKLDPNYRDARERLDKLR